MMTKLIHWLSAHRLVAILIALLYFVLVILPHEWVGNKISSFFSTIPRSAYDQIILVISLLILTIVGLVYWKKIRTHPRKTKLLLWFSLTIFFMSLVNNFLFVANIESVHYVQYAIGATLLFGLIGNYFVALFVAFLISLIDEGYQYFFLTPDNTDYFDFNDIITDFLGAVFGLLLVKVLSIKEWGDVKKKMVHGIFFPLAISLILFLGILQSNILSIYPSNDKFNLVKQMEEGFWRTVPQKLINPKIALGEYLKKHPKDKKARKLFRDLKDSIQKRNAYFSEKTGISIGQKDENGKQMNFGLLMKELEATNDHEFILLSRKVISMQKDTEHYLREFWEAGIPENQLSMQFPEITFHVVGPKEGSVILMLLFGLYYFCFREEKTS